MRNALLLFTLSLVTINAMSQELPYATIPDAPTEFTAVNVAARMIDGLGFRYYWATEGLNIENMETQGTDEARTIGETIRHIRDLSNGILRSVSKEPTVSVDYGTQTFYEIRTQTLKNLDQAATILRKSTDADMKDMDVVFKRGEGESRFPFWNLINGQIEDAVWHAGQIVTLRRISGNPINPKVNVFMGKLND
ncbi:MAG: hypothetical protein NWP83_03695 [Spirosomaceae bacterium]|nr:hypothetical protein [Spirosomataceae bacterium]